MEKHSADLHICKYNSVLLVILFQQFYLFYEAVPTDKIWSVKLNSACRVVGSFYSSC
jgi:hypothetical protein